MKLYIKIFVALMMSVFLYGCCTIKKPEVEIKYRESPHVYKSVVRVEITLAGDSTQGFLAAAFAINKQYLVTAGHFCRDAQLPFMSRELDMYVLNNNDEVMKSGHPKIVVINKKYDLCLLKLDKHGVVPLKIIKKYHKNIRIGDDVISVGSPYGYFPVLTSGKVVDKYDENGRLTISVPAAPGNSGGPVLNDLNEVVGVTVMRDIRYHHISHATPAIKLRKFLKQNGIVIE